MPKLTRYEVPCDTASDTMKTRPYKYIVWYMIRAKNKLLNVSDKIGKDQMISTRKNYKLN